jgi:hypothetical protein
MVILLDVNNRLINVYTDNGLESFDFSNVNALNKYTAEEDVIYITNAVKTSIEDIKNTVNVISENLGDIQIKKNEKSFIRSVKGYIILDKLNLKLKGPLDFKPLSNFDKDFLNDTQIKNLLKIKKIEIITESEIQKIIAKDTQNKAKKQSKVDKSLDSILVPMGVKAGDAAVDIFGGASDAIEIEINPNAIGGVGTSNENSLVGDIDLSELEK